MRNPPCKVCGGRITTSVCGACYEYGKESEIDKQRREYVEEQVAEMREDETEEAMYEYEEKAKE